MILLLGGTSDAPPIAMRLAEAGYRVLVSQATDVPLETPRHGNIEARCGPLDERGLAELVDRRAIRAIVDASPSLRRRGPRSGRPGRRLTKASPACAFFARRPSRQPLPAWNLSPTMRLPQRPRFVVAGPCCSPRERGISCLTSSRRVGPACSLMVRVLDHPQSLDACRRAGIRPEQVIAGRGPFSVEDNRRHIRAAPPACW